MLPPESLERRRALARALHERQPLAARLAALDAQLAELRRRLLEIQRVLQAALSR